MPDARSQQTQTQHGLDRAVRRELATAADDVRNIEDELADVRGRLTAVRERRRAAVVAARVAGATYAEIGEALGVSAQRARAIAADAVFSARREAASRNEA